MIITAIEPIPLRIPFKAGNTSDASAWGDCNLPAADALLVKVTTDHGLIGWGKAFGFRAVVSAKLAIDQLVAPLFGCRPPLCAATVMGSTSANLHSCAHHRGCR
jgi:L-alanine-DL-glutamate epimerase-like enolase superfamily enzyme